MRSPTPPTVEPAAPPDPEPQPAPHWENGYRFVGLTIVLLLTFGLLLFLAPVLDVILAGLLISFLMHGPSRFLARRTPLSPGAAVVVAYLLLFLALSWLTWQGAKAFNAGIQNAAAELNELALDISGEITMPEGVPQGAALRDVLQQLGISNVPQLVGEVQRVAGAAGGHLSMGMKNILGLVMLVFTAAFFSLFLQLGLLSAGGRLRASLSPAYHREMSQLLLNLDGVWVGYAMAMLVYCGLLTVGSFILFWLLGVPFPLPMAIFNGLITLIPSIGGLIGTIVTVAICLAFGSTRFTTMPPGTFALIVAVIHFVLVQVTYNLVALPVISRFVRLPVVAVLAGVLAALASGNVLVAFLVPPLFSTLRLVTAYILAKVRRTEPFTGPDLPRPTVPGFFSQLMYALK